MVEIYVIPIPEESDDSILKEKLSPFLRDLKPQTKNGKANRQGMISSLSYALVQYIIGLKIDSNAPFHISHTKQGKPFFTELPDIQFNISHSGLYTCIAISHKTPVGIDVERIRTCNPEIVTRFFHKQESDDILAIPPGISRDLYFTRLWSLKESYVKYLGTGIANVFNRFHLQIVNDVVVPSENVENASFKLYSLFEDYQLSVCSSTDSFCKTPTFLSLENIGVL